MTEPASSNAGVSYVQRYAIIKYDLGIALSLQRVPVYIYGGYNGDHNASKANAPIGQAHDGPYAGVDVKL